MADKTVVAALSLVSRSCADALAAFASPPGPDPAPLPVVFADLDRLLALLYSAATKLALALKPAAPSASVSASVPLLHDLARDVAALPRSTRLLSDDLHGAALVKDTKRRIADIVGALCALVQTFLDNAPGDEYLVRTATLHDLITSATAAGVPRDNQAVVHVHWKLDGEALDDNFQEIARLIDEAESPEGAAADHVDDGWDEIGLGSELGADELARAKSVHGVLRLTTLLHKRISLDLLPYPSSAPLSAFDALLAQSNQLLSTSDDLVAALYSPQEPPYIRQGVLQLAKIATCLRAQITILLPADGPAHTPGVDDRSATSSPTKKRANKKWFDICVDQIVRVCTRVSESTAQMGNDNDGT